MPLTYYEVSMPIICDVCVRENNWSIANLTDDSQGHRSVHISVTDPGERPSAEFRPHRVDLCAEHYQQFDELLFGKDNI